MPNQIGSQSRHTVILHHGNEIMSNLADIAKSLVAPGKGILAADESAPTIEKRFKGIQVALYA